ncbi:MAG: MFS transporter [Chloroflexi bacterium]|jgi:MFS transporter, UMF1 family|nr:MFS transporter [Chloroflexota bacterium]MBT3671288.1 MFS transporter [Chloroflexota bacterium]MBT4001769.1 MFS transporter [Chloroflexota bacterium]MBT4304253.1 MFS transporter [Chloroflexota bacterium]MBT4534272.1 MFS transporter [Chloroflexota bacterium]
MKNEKHKSNREQWAWYFYDFGNSAYAAVVLLAIYSAYFQGEVVGGSDGTRLWGIAIGIAMVVAGIISPILGTIADHSGKKKPLLLAMTSLSIIFTALLFFVEKGSVFTGMLFFILAEIGYRGGQVFYNSLLPEIATQKEIAAVSGKGWAIGSAGGILCLVIVLGLILSFEGTFVVRLSFVITAIFYALSTIPLVFWIKEKAVPKSLEVGENYLGLAIRKLKKTFKSVKDYKQFLRFMLAYLIYNDGILAAMDFAAILGAVLFGMEQQQLIIFMIIVQVFSVLGAYIYALIGERFGFKRGLIQSLLLMIAAVVGIYFNSGLTGFFIIGGVAGFALTGVQSLSRTMIGAFAPPGQSAEFFGFFGMVGRTSSFIGPFVFGYLADKLVDFYAMQGMILAEAEILGHKQAIISIVVFLVLGLILLQRVNEEEGRKLSIVEDTSGSGD